MTSIEAKGAVFWMAFASLSRKEKRAVLERLLADKEFREDLLDIATTLQREGEPTRPFREYLTYRMN